MAARKRRRGRPQEEQISEAQQRTLEQIRDFIASRQYPPTLQELGDLLGVTAASIHQHVKILERKGYVSREHRKARSLAILREPEQELETLVPVPLLGQVNAGPTLFAEEYHEGDVLVDKSVAGRGRCFALRVSGDSMTGAGMRDGDVVIVRQQAVAQSGEIVVALIDGESTVKRLFIYGDRIELRPENKRYKPIVIGPGDDFSVLGKVLAVRGSIGE